MNHRESTVGSGTGFRFGTKARTLESLNGALHKARLCPQITVARTAWFENADAVAEDILTAFGGKPLAVRSSARGEDSDSESLAGAFTSLLHVAPDASAIGQAVNHVFASYHTNHEADEVLIQPMVENVVLSGVVLTRDLDTGSPYYAINYDQESGRTDTVTSGANSKTVLVHRARPDRLKSPRMRRLIDSVIEIEGVTGSHELDVEFCITGDNDVFILQVRPLAARSKWAQVPDAVIDAAIDNVRERIVEVSAPVPDLGGDQTVLSEMTDWNPVEMIGNAPRPLALSLYKWLITDGIWAEARARMGYRMVGGPLLHDFYGHPYIDVRKSLNSFLPAGIDRAHADAIVTHQLSILTENRELHDKVEFAIAVTCADFETGKIETRLTDAGLNAAAQSEVGKMIHALTKTLIDAGAQGMKPLTAQANSLLSGDAGSSSTGRLAQAQQLLMRCRTDGTLPFSQLARHGFIGVQILRSLVTRGAFDEQHAERFMHGVRTIATELIQDINAVHAGELDVDGFMATYGHLRPGTYDITSLRYEESPELYLGHGEPRLLPAHEPFVPDTRQRGAIQDLIDEIGFDITTDALLDYISAAIKGREQSKFAFTRAISDALKLISKWGAENGLSRDDLSYLPIQEFTGDPDPARLRELVAAAREDYVLTRALRLPHLIIDAFDIDVVRIPLGQPTFVTSGSAIAECHVLTEIDPEVIDGRIVLIESADPGFDWIFSHDIRGLITKYGGANSHMAIRCAEFGLPAAIGCGERLFDSLSKARTIELNAAARRVSGH
ncbi:MAG: hypothetical protein JJ855_09235 [Rhodospirillales bacterium]|nr:hypothetical protein [Rhodospirillales bacterium]